MLRRLLSSQGPQCLKEKTFGEEKEELLRKKPTASFTFAKDIELPSLLTKKAALLEELADKVTGLVFDTKPNSTTVGAFAELEKNIPLNKGGLP